MPAETAAENWPVAPIEPELRRSKITANKADNNLEDGKTTAKSEDVGFLKRELGKSIEENQLKNIEIGIFAKKKNNLVM